MSVAEFRNLGYLQEVNRRFLHPLGLALEVVADDRGAMRFGGVWDHRDDLEGIVFDSLAPEPRKSEYVADEWARRELPRVAALGFMVQPVERGTGAARD